MAEQVEIFRAILEDALEILALQELAYQSEAQIYDDWSIPLCFKLSKKLEMSSVPVCSSKPSASTRS